jgi:hypothetical protein
MKSLYQYILCFFFFVDEMFIGFIHIGALYVYTFLVWIIGAMTALVYNRVHTNKNRPMLLARQAGVCYAVL